MGPPGKAAHKAKPGERSGCRKLVVERAGLVKAKETGQRSGVRPGGGCKEKQLCSVWQHADYNQTGTGISMAPVQGDTHGFEVFYLHVYIF